MLSTAKLVVQQIWQYDELQVALFGDPKRSGVVPKLLLTHDPSRSRFTGYFIPEMFTRGMDFKVTKSLCFRDFYQLPSQLPSRKVRNDML